MMTPNLLRRRLLMAAATVPLVPALESCRASLPPAAVTTASDAAPRLLEASALAHGEAAFLALHDVSVSYFGHWARLVSKLQPALVDAGFRGGSQERILLGADTIAQTHTGKRGSKQVFRRGTVAGAGDVSVWFNGTESRDRDARDAAALVADAYMLFLFGAMLVRKWVVAGRVRDLAIASPQQIGTGRDAASVQVVRMRLEPGLGFAQTDDLALYVDRETHLMRRVRFTLNGLQSTLGALVDVDLLEHHSHAGVVWPAHFNERLLRPAPLQVHDWRLTGLDLDRGLEVADVSAVQFNGKAAAPAAPLVAQ